MAANPSTLALWLKFISDIAWPVAVFGAIFIFRSHFRSLLARLSSFKMGDAEIAFQAPAPDAKIEPPATRSEILTYDKDKALPESAVRDVVRATGEITQGDEIYKTIQIFATHRQATWLIFSKKKIFCVLDDEGTRQSGRLVQWSLERERATPVAARPARPGVGLLDIGPRRNWLYSEHLFPMPELLVAEIQNTLKET